MAPKSNKPKADMTKTLNLVEELLWLMDENKDINYRDTLRQIKEIRNLTYHTGVGEKKSTYSLIGVLPSLLRDEELFPSNGDLANFAVDVLSIDLVRWRKKSRNELIGLIICEVEEANRNKIDLLIDWSEKILANKNEIKKMQSSSKNDGNLFSWNEAIQKIVGVSNESSD